MLIKIDYRETSLEKEISIIKNSEQCYSNINIEICSLPLGDIIICDDNNKEIMIIERKTLNDLAASIRDGRYAEQGSRLDACDIHNHAIIYLIEGDICRFKPSKYGSRPIDAKALLSAMTSISYTKGFSIYKSSSIHESALWLLQTTYKLEKISDNYYYNNKEKDIKPYAASAINHRVKKDNITRENICAFMLSQIPGVSSASALAVCERYNTMDLLIDALRKDHLAISDITTTTKSGNSRKLTRTCVNNIYNYLITGSVETISVDNNS